MNDTKQTENDKVVTITDSAIDEIKRLASKEKDEKLFLRLGVAAGGCSGMSYSMGFDTEATDSDKIINYTTELTVIIDNKAVSYLEGTVLDYKGGMLGGGFAFENPNAKRSCGCGTSFSC